MSGFALGLTGIAIMFALLILRQPVWLALALCGIVGNALLNSVSMTKFVTGTGTFDLASSYALSVIPLFVSGSSVATAASMTRIALPEMERAGYEKGYAASSVAAGGSLGILIPPSIILVIYGSIAEASVARLFAASMIPGVALMGLYMGVAWFLAARNVQDAADLPVTFVDRCKAILRPWHFLLLFIATIGGIYTGLFSPNEAASIGAFGAIMIGFARRTLTWSVLVQAIQNSVIIACGLFMIIIGAKLFATFVVQTRLPDSLLDLAQGAELSPLMVMALIVLIYIVMGCFLEGIGMVLITVPVFLPVVEGYGFDPIWFGVLVVVLVELGLITPPVGMNLFIIKAQAQDMPMATLYRAITPFLAAPIVLVALLFAAPGIALWLPRVLF